MQYLIIAHETPEEFGKRKDQAAFKAYIDPWFAYSQALSKAGVLEGGQALEGPETATCVSVRNGVRSVQDGPFTDSKEQIGGFFLINVDTPEEAAEWAAKCPSSTTGFVEVRGVPSHG